MSSHDRRLIVRLGVWTCVVGLACASPASAQRADGPFSGILGAAPSVDRTEGLDLRGSFFGSYDRNIVDDAASAELDPRLAQSGGGGGALASLSYQMSGDRLRLALGGNAAARAYATGSAPFVGIYGASGSVSANLTSRVVADVSGNVTYAPFYDFAPFAGMSALGATTVGPGFGYAAVAQRNLWVVGTAGLTSNFSRRSSVSARVSRSQMRMVDVSGNAVQNWSADVAFRHSLTRALGLHLGYGRQFADYSFATDASYRNETIDAGVDYGDSVSFSRRTALAFSTSTSVIRYLNETHFRVNGSLQLTRGFGRSWGAFASYNRNTLFDAGFRGPLLNDSIAGGIGGQLAARMRWWNTVGATRGTAGFDPRPFTTYGATTRLDVAVTRTIALFGQYGYYAFDVPEGISTFTIPRRFARGSAAMGLTVWLPLVDDTRAPQEPRQR